MNSKEYFKKHSEFIVKQVDKYYDLIKDAAVFIGWKVQGRPFSKNIRICIDFDPLSIDKIERYLTLELTLSGKGPEKIEFILLDTTDMNNSFSLGRLVFDELLSWTAEDDRKLVDHLKRINKG